MDVPPCDVSPSTRARDLLSLLQTSTLSDITFDVEGSSIRAHKCILAEVSAVFNEICRSSERKISGEDPQLFRYLLEFIYSGGVEVEKEDVKKLGELSAKFKVTSLTSLCTAHQNASTPG